MKTICVLLVMASAAVAAQGPTFEVASVKPNNSGAVGGSIGAQPGGINDTSELPIYALVLARADGKTGAAFRRSEVDCDPARGGGAPPPPPQPGARPSCGLRTVPGSIIGGGVNMRQLARNLSNYVGRFVVDRTGLMGGCDLDLTFTPDQLPQGPPPPGAPPRPLIDPNGPSLFTALQEQLGLKLESRRGPVDVLVIDSAERPTPD